MTDPDDLDLQRLDHAAARAARGLHDHVGPRLDADQVLARIPASSPRRRPGRLLTVAAAVAVLVGSVAVLSDHSGDDGRSRLELDEDGNKLPTPQPGTLTALAPHDGKDSIQLPLTVTPSATGLEDGDTVTVSAPGFQPGESVGLVQCAQEAGGETREQRGGIDACDISPYTSITADADGVATGEYQVQRFLTTPLTGTVDCAAKAERCLVAMGALSDYDRSGGFGITFEAPADGAPSIDIPTLVVTPAEGLADGDTVHLVGDGFAPNTNLGLDVCSKDPSACWVTGAALDPAPDDSSECIGECGTIGGFGVRSDSAGHVEAEVPVWRYLPTTEAGTYVDCAVSECRLRVSAGDATAPPPPLLHFTAGGPGPIPPAIAVDPSTDLEVGQTVVVRGAGFEPGAFVDVSVCVNGADGTVLGCIGGNALQPLVEEDGTFAVEFELPDVSQMGELTATTTGCAAGVPCPSTPVLPTCGGAQAACSIRVDSYHDLPTVRPQFSPAPVPVTFRSAG